MNENNPNNPDPSFTHAFDPEKAARMRAQAMDTFKTAMKKIERRFYRWLIFMLALSLFAVYSFFQSTDTQSWILWSVLLLLPFMGIVVLKFWYWIMNNKIGVLREIRLLRLDLAVQKGAIASLEDIILAEPAARSSALSKEERWFWYLVIFALAVAFGALFTRSHVRPHANASMISHRTVMLEADGTGRMETTTLLENSDPAPTPMRDFTVYAGGVMTEPKEIAPADSPWTDGAGRKLGFRIEPAGQNYRSVIHLIDPVPPGEPFTLRRVKGIKASRDGDVWTFTMSQNWGYRHNHYVDTVTLPVGAQVVSVKPVPQGQEVRNGATVVRFETTLGSNAKWQYTVKYRLPSNTVH